MPFFTAVIALIGTIGTFVASLGGIGAALLSIGLNLAAQYVLKLFAKKPPSGVELEVQFGESISRTVSYGLTASAGHLVYVNSYGSANSMLQHLRVISDFYTTSLEKVYINGKLETLGTTSTLGKVVSSGEFANRIWIKFVDGRQTTPDSIIIANSNPAGRVDATDSLLGCSYVIVTMAFDREVLNSVPEFLFEYKGAPIYDWRKDTSVGGLGTHRFNDINTWEYSANPILLAYAYHRGIKINNDIFAGMEVSESDLPLGKWSTACNICDETVGSEKRYAISFQVNCSETHGDNIDAIMRSCGGFISEGVEGIWPIVGSNQTVVATFTDDDIIVNSSKNFRRYRPMSELVNSVSGTFISPEQQWSAAGYTRAFDNGLLTVDRKTRDVDMNFDTVNSLRQASQLAAIYFKENRYEKTATLTLRPFFQDLEVGDWVQWNSDISYKTGIYMVSGYELVSDSDEEGPRNVRIQLVERGSQMYDAVTPIPFPTIINPAEPVYQQELVNFAVVGQTIVGANSTQQSALRASWNTPTDPSVAGVIIEYRVKGGPADAIITKTVNNGAIVTILSDGVVKNTVYEVRHRLITDPFRFTVPTAWVEVTSSNAENPIDWEELSLPVQTLLTDLDLRADQLFDRNTDDAWNDIDSMLGTMVASQNNMLVDGQSFARVTRETRLLATQDLALATDIVGAQAAIDQISGNALLEVRAEATPNGYLSRVAAYVRGEDGEASSSAAFALQAFSTGGIVKSQFLVNAEQFIIVSPSSQESPFVFESGILKLRSAFIGDLTAENFLGNNIIATSVEAGAITASSLAVGSITTESINIGAVTENVTMNAVSPVSYPSGGFLIGTITITFSSEADLPKLFIAAKCSFLYTWSSSGSFQSGSIRIFCDDRNSNNRIVAEKVRLVGGGTGSGSETLAINELILDAPIPKLGTATVTYDVVISPTGTNFVGGPSNIFYWKR